MTKGKRNIDVENKVEFSLPLPDLHAEYLKITRDDYVARPHEDVTQPALVVEPEHIEISEEVVEAIHEEILIIDVDPDPPPSTEPVKEHVDVSKPKMPGIYYWVAVVALVFGASLVWQMEQLGIDDTSEAIETLACIETQDQSPAANVDIEQLWNKKLNPESISASRVQIKPEKPLQVSNHLEAARRMVHLGREALKAREAQKAIRFFMTAQHKLKGTASDESKLLAAEVNRLHGNALYLEGFFALRNHDRCKAKKYFLAAYDVSPEDQKIVERLDELDDSLSC